MKPTGAELPITSTRAVSILGQAAGVAVALALAAKIRVWLPWSPVPMTLQTFVVLSAPALCGVAAGAVGVALYVAAASAGLPVMAGPSVFGPTGGYLLGFVAAAALVAHYRSASPLRLLLAMAGASVLIYLCGATWLWAWSGKSLGWIWAAGVLPFLPGDAAKILAAWAAVGVARASSRGRG